MLPHTARENPSRLTRAKADGHSKSPALRHPDRTDAALRSHNMISPSSTTRVVHVALGTQIGGMERLLVEFARQTDRQSFSLDFVSLEHCGPIAAELEAAGCSVTSFHKTPGLKPWLVFQLAGHFRRSRARVIHTHNTAGFFYGVLAAKLACVPRVVHTRHGQRFLASKRETTVFRNLSRFADHIVSVSQDSQRLTIEEGIDANRCCVIHNGINVDRFSFVGPQTNGPVILVARLSPEKDVATLIRAFDILTKRFAERSQSLSLQIVGDGSERESLENLAATLNCSRQIHFLGQQRDVESRLSAASMFVLPSISEGISLTLLEAMARGLPVVATQVGGTPEVVRHGETGWLVPAGDPNAMASAMAQFVLDPNLGLQMGRKARQQVEQGFDVLGMVRAYEDLYVGRSQREVAA